MPRVSNFTTPRIILYKKYDFFKNSPISFYYKFFFRQIRLNFFLFYFLKYELQKFRLKTIHIKIFSNSSNYYINIFIVNPIKKIFFFRWRRMKFFLFKFRHLSLNFIKKRTKYHLKKKIKKKYFMNYYKSFVNKINMLKNFTNLLLKRMRKKSLSRYKRNKSKKYIKIKKKITPQRVKKVCHATKGINQKNILKLRRKVQKKIKKLKNFFIFFTKIKTRKSKFKRFYYVFNFKKFKSINKLVCKINLIKTFLKVPSKLFLIFSLLTRLKIKNALIHSYFNSSLINVYIYFVINYLKKSTKKRYTRLKKFSYKPFFLFLNKIIFYSFCLIKQILFTKYLTIKTKLTVLLRGILREDLKINFLFYKPARRLLTKIVLLKCTNSLQKSFFKNIKLLDQHKLNQLTNYSKFLSYFFVNPSIGNINKKLVLNYFFRKKFNKHFVQQVKKKKRKLLKFLVLSLLFNDAQLFSSILIKFLKKVKKGHNNFFFKWLQEIKYWFNWLNRYFLIGPKMFKIIISGKLNNKMKTTTKIMHSSDFLKTSTLEHILSYQANYVFGRAGVYGLKIFFG